MLKKKRRRRRRRREIRLSHGEGNPPENGSCGGGTGLGRGTEN